MGLIWGSTQTSVRVHPRDQARFGHAAASEVTTTPECILTHTHTHRFATADNSPVHDEALSPFSTEGQISPDRLGETETQVKDIKKQKHENAERRGVKETGDLWPLLCRCPTQHVFDYEDHVYGLTVNL